MIAPVSPGAKTFATLRSRLALAGWTLLRSDPADGAVVVLAGKAGQWRQLHTIDDLESMLIHCSSELSSCRP